MEKMRKQCNNKAVPDCLQNLLNNQQYYKESGGGISKLIADLQAELDWDICAKPSKDGGFTINFRNRNPARPLKERNIDIKVSPDYTVQHPYLAPTTKPKTKRADCLKNAAELGYTNPKPPVSLPKPRPTARAKQSSGDARKPVHPSPPPAFPSNHRFRSDVVEPDLNMEEMEMLSTPGITITNPSNEGVAAKKSSVVGEKRRSKAESSSKVSSAGSQPKLSESRKSTKSTVSPDKKVNGAGSRISKVSTDPAVDAYAAAQRGKSVTIDNESAPPKLRTKSESGDERQCNHHLLVALNGDADKLQLFSDEVTEWSKRNGTSVEVNTLLD